MPFRQLQEVDTPPQSNTPTSQPTKTNFRVLSNTNTATPPKDIPVSRPPTSQPTEKKDNFLVSMAKGIVKPFAEVGTSVYNAASSADKLFQGDIQGADQELRKKRNIPFLGETKPAVTGDESLGEATKKMAGYGADIASTIVGGGGVSQVAKQGGKQFLNQAVKTGLKTGGITGFLGEAGRELEKDDGSVVEAFKKGFTGAAIGAPIGAATGFIGGRIANRLKNADKIVDDKITKEAIEITRPPMNKKQMTEALRAGRGTNEGILKTTEISPAKRDYDVADAVKGLVSKKKTPVENISTVRNALAEEAQILKDKIKQNDIDFNLDELTQRIDQHEAPIMLKSDQTMDNAYNIIKQRLVDLVKKRGNKTSNVLDARVDLDNLVERELGDIYKDQRMTPLKQAVRDFRSILNDFVAEKVPDANVKGSLTRQSRMYDAIDGMSSNATKDVGKNMLQRFGDKYPRLKTAAKYGGAAALGKLGFDKLTGN